MHVWVAARRMRVVLHVRVPACRVWRGRPRLCRWLLPEGQQASGGTPSRLLQVGHGEPAIAHRRSPGAAAAIGPEADRLGGEVRGHCTRRGGVLLIGPTCWLPGARHGRRVSLQ